MTNRFIIGFFALILASIFSPAEASSLVEVNLAEENESQPVLYAAYENSKYIFRNQDARIIFTSFLGENAKNLFTIKSKNMVLFKLQARKDIEFVSSSKKYTADEDDNILFGITLGASGTLSTHTSEILLPKDYYWPGQKAKKVSESITTVLAILQQWGNSLGVDNFDKLGQLELCNAIEDKLHED